MDTHTQLVVDEATKRQVTESVAHTLIDYYVFPEIGAKMGQAILDALARGDYNPLDSPESLCERLTSDLQAVNRDKHVRVRYNEEARPVTAPREDYSPEEIAAYIDMARRQNFGFYRVERLAGNIGYLDLRNLWDAGWEGAGDTAAAAMSLLYHTEALIIDLRRNNGGTPSMVALLTSYLLDPDPVHLNSFYNRSEDKTTQTWTFPYIPGKRMPGKPVYVLTGKNTFSGAEEFAYNLKNLKRATLIGETTGGGAHPGGDVQITPHFRVFVPIGRPINAISGTNWEGTGVEPDIAVPQEDALKLAHRMALEGVLANLGDNPTGAARSQAEEVRAALAEENS